MARCLQVGTAAQLAGNQLSVRPAAHQPFGIHWVTAHRPEDRLDVHRGEGMRRRRREMAERLVASLSPILPSNHYIDHL
jgi:hypothetical protein